MISSDSPLKSLFPRTIKWIHACKGSVYFLMCSALLSGCGGISGQLYFSKDLVATGQPNQNLKNGTAFDVPAQLDTRTDIEGLQYSISLNVTAPIGTDIKVLLNDAIVANQKTQAATETVSVSDITLPKSSNTFLVKLTYAGIVDNSYTLTLNKL